MAYTPPTDTGSDEYVMVIKHNASNLMLEIKMIGVDEGTPPTRAVKDNVFQATVDKLTSIPGTTLMTARRAISYASSITPT